MKKKVVTKQTNRNDSVILKSQDRRTIRQQFFWLSTLFLLGMLLFLFYLYSNLSNSLFDKDKQVVRHFSEIGMAVIRHFHELQLAGDLTETEARELAAHTLEKATYGEHGYYWVNRGDGVMLMHPYSKEFIGQNLFEWKDVKGKELFKEFTRRAKQGGDWVDYYWPKPDSDTEYRKISYVAYFHPWDWVLGTGIYLDEVEQEIEDIVLRASAIELFVLLIFIFVSVYFAERLIDRLGQLSIQDQLTGLYSRRFLMESIPSILKRQEREKRMLTIVFVDIDFFKQINDTYGHVIGDQVLATTAKLIQDLSRPDDLCIRFGGEEFVFVGQFDDEESVLRYTNRLRTAIADLSFESEGKIFNVTISAGITFFQPEHETFEQALSRADDNLYQAKQAGRNTVIFE